MSRRIRLAFLWHMHQPSYWDPERGEFLLPWTRLHATKDYVDMVRILEKFPGIRATFNLTPSLLDQLDQIGAGVSDPYLDVARKPAASLTESDRAFLVAHFFDLHHERMLEPHPRYRELRAKAGQAAVVTGAAPEGRAAASLTTQDLLDLQVWFHLAWVDPSFRVEEPLRALVEKGTGFTEAEKQTLLDWGVRCAASVAETCRAAAASGRIELTTSAYHHPILPLLIDSDAPREVSSTIPLPAPPFRFPRDAEEQVRRARASHERRFGTPPRGTWPPEGAVSDAALATIARAGFTWAASDEAVLAAALTRQDGGLRDWPRALYRPWRVDTEGGPITMVFRDRRLSDLIGFTYSHWDPVQAAEDFVRRVHEAAQDAGPDETTLVTVILDGENCWESYLDDGNPFLEALYRRLESDPDIATVTLSQAIQEVPAAKSLQHVPVGSWIRPDLGIWVGHPDKNHAWEELSRARRVADDAQRSGLPSDRLAGAFEELYAAEASDWFWWYGPEHPSAHRDAFDRLFRSRLTKAYAELGVPAPSSLASSLREDAIETTPDRAAMEEGREPVPYVRAVMDGRETDFFEWRDATRHEAAGATGAMHQVTGPIETVRFGTDGKSLYIRIDARGDGSAPPGSSLAIEFGGDSPRVARADLGRARGVLAWSGGGDAKGNESTASYVRDAILEIEIPLRRAGAVAGAHLPFRLTLEANGQPEQVVPASGWLSLPVPHVDLGLTIWSAL